MKTIKNNFCKINRVIFFAVIIQFIGNRAMCQDTFSIVGLDSTSRQIGSAGASCLDLYFAGITDPAFLTDILPDTGVVNTQSYFIQANQDNARSRLRMGNTPAQTITWLIANDANNNPQFKQYGIVAFNGNSPSSASHTGTACINYKNHINGNINGFYYAIQGNILMGQNILDSMEARFRNTNGSLSCRLMAAMQGAKVIGADTRCNTSSSLFAFMQVANPTDVHGNPSLNISLRTKAIDNVEPIDSLQKLFNINQGCLNVGLSKPKISNAFSILPNPTSSELTIEFLDTAMNDKKIELINLVGQIILKEETTATQIKLNLNNHAKGVYFIRVTGKNFINIKKIIKE